MIVVCTGCGAKFKVADEKVGPKGARLRCSRCQTVFTVRHEEAAPGAATAPAPAVPPPLPTGRRAAAPASPELGAPVDHRSAFEIDLEPPPRAAPDDPFAAPLHDDPFAAAAEADPFAAVQAPVPPEPRRDPPADVAPPGADDPFGASLPPLADVKPEGDLALEERTTPPPRIARPQSSAPLDDPFGGPGEPGGIDFDAGHPGDVPPMSGELPGEPFGGFDPAASLDGAHEPAAAPRQEAPAGAEPSAARAGRASPVRAGAAPRTPGHAAEEEPEVSRSRALARLRSAAVNAVSLLALLVVALVILVVWRGNVPLSEAVDPRRLLAALAPQGGAAAAFSPRGVTSGLYERARGAPLLFVRGEVVSNAPAPVAGVRVAVELVRDGVVVARGEALAGGLLTPEELHGAADAAALERAAAAAAARAAGPVAPGQALPFLVALADYPADLAGVALRVRAVGEAAR